MSIETVDVISPAEGSGGVTGRVSGNGDEELAREISHASEYIACHGRGVEVQRIDKKNGPKNVQAPGASLTSWGVTSLETMEEIKAEHRRLWEKVRKKLVAGLCKRDLNKGLEQLKLAKIAGDILSVVVRGQRQAWGLDVLEGEISADDREEIIEEMVSLTVPSRADKVMD